jgi:hypothetical protein
MGVAEGIAGAEGGPHGTHYVDGLPPRFARVIACVVALHGTDGDSEHYCLLFAEESRVLGR